MGKDQPASCSYRDQEKEMEMDRTYVEKAKAKYSKRGYAVEPTGRERQKETKGDMAEISGEGQEASGFGMGGVNQGSTGQGYLESCDLWPVS